MAAGSRPLCQQDEEKWTLGTHKIIISASVKCVIFMVWDRFPTSNTHTGMAAAVLLCRYVFCHHMYQSKRSDIKASPLTFHSLFVSLISYFFLVTPSLSLTGQIYTCLQLFLGEFLYCKRGTLPLLSLSHLFFFSCSDSRP